MPYYPDADSEKGQPYEIETYWEQVVSKYTGLSMADVYELSVVDFMFFRREAFITELSKTEKGREYLENAWMLEQTDADYEGLRQIQNEMEGGTDGRKY